MCDIHWFWQIYLNLAMPGKDSTTLNIELAVDESLTPFPMSLCGSQPFHSGWMEIVCRVKFPGFFVCLFVCLRFSLYLPRSEPPWAAFSHRQWSLSLKMCTTFSSCGVIPQAASFSGFPFVPFI
jgi:hypothetical protein